MKTFSVILFFAFSCCRLNATVDSIPAGAHEIVIGKKYDEIKQFLDPKPVWPYFVLNEIKVAGDAAPSEETYGPKTVYLVKKSQKKFFIYMNAPVTRMEVNFDEENLVREIYILIPDTKDNETKVRAGSAAVFGSFFCAVADEDPKFSCVCNRSEYDYSVANWDGKREESYEEDKLIYVCFIKTNY